MQTSSHLVRQERNGGYWLIRDEGRAVELDHDGFKLMERLAANAGEIGDDEYGPLADALATGLTPQLVEQLDRAQLRRGESAGWKRVRVVYAPTSILEQPPGDVAVVAPKRIYFEITRGCNLACTSCFNNSHRRLADELSFDEIIEVNRQAEEIGVFEIRYTGGECTLVPGFADIVADARARNLYVSIGTNGVYTDEQLEWLPTSGVDWFIISLDGDQKANNKVRGRGTFDAVLRTLTVLAEHPGIRVRLNMVVAKHNMSAIESVAEVASRNRVTSLNLIPLRPYGRATRRLTDSMFRREDFYCFIREVNRLRKQFTDVNFSTTIDLLDPQEMTSHDLIVQKKQTCAAGVEACVIGPQGHVYGCSYSPASFPDQVTEAERIFIAGNIREDLLASIWRDSARWAVFRDLSRYKNSKCRTCSHYTKRCSGSCQIMSYYEMKYQQGVALGTKQLGDFYDPYCFVDLLGEQGKERMVDLPAPCGGGGIDGF